MLAAARPVSLARRARCMAALALALIALASASCMLVPESGSNKTRADIMQQIGPGKVTPAEIQSDVMSFADNYAELVEQALTESLNPYIAKRPELRQRAVMMKLDMIQGAVTIAAEANPVTAMLDLAVMVTLQHEVWVEYWVPQVWGEAGEPLTEALTTLEKDIWEIVAQALTPTEQDALRELIRQVRQQYPNQILVTGLRASEFAQDRQQSFVKIKGGISLLSLFQLDPLAGLNPTTREFHQARLLGERAFFYVKRLPNLLRWQAEAYALEVASLHEVQSLVASAQNASDAMAQLEPTIARLEKSLPEGRDRTLDMIESRFNTMRDEAVRSIQATVTAEREAFFRDLADAPPKVNEALTNLRATVESAQQLSISLTALVDDFDRLAHTLRLDEPANPDSKGFDAAAFERMSAETTKTATELRMLVESVRTLIESPEAKNAASGADVIGEGFIDRVFTRGLILIAALGVSLFLALTASRLVTNRTRPSTRG